MATAMQNSVATFLREFIFHPREVGSLIPSSKALARALVEEAKLHGAKALAELGTGIGVVTEEIERMRPPSARFFALEVNPRLYEVTGKRCPTVNVYCDSALQLRPYLEREGIKKLDTIISSLPWASFDDTEQDALLDVITMSLRPGGRFVTFAYLIGLALPQAKRFRTELVKRFSSVTMPQIIWGNMPPALIYSATQ